MLSQVKKYTGGRLITLNEVVHTVNALKLASLLLASSAAIWIKISSEQIKIFKSFRSFLKIKSEGESDKAS